MRYIPNFPIGGDEPIPQEELAETIERIYKAYLPEYLEQSWSSGRGEAYEKWLKEQLNWLVIEELCDDAQRFEELRTLEENTALIFGIFGAAFRILDHTGMHLRAQTFGQYELWQEDEALLYRLCKKFLERRKDPSTWPEFFGPSLNG